MESACARAGLITERQPSRPGFAVSLTLQLGKICQGLRAACMGTRACSKGPLEGSPRGELQVKSEPGASDLGGGKDSELGPTCTRTQVTEMQA